MLSQALQAWDDKTTSKLGEMYPHYSNHPEFPGWLIALLKQQTTEVGASWLLKHHLEQGGQLSNSEINSFMSSYHQFTFWSSRLHWLQSLPYFKIARRHIDKIEALLRYAISDDNKFVRAWAYNGLVHLAVSFEDLREEVLSLCELALNDESASVKSRIRNAVKSLHQQM